MGAELETKGMTPIAEQAAGKDVETLQKAKTQTLTYKPDELANGANGLLDRGRDLEDQRRGGALLTHRI